MRLYFRRAMTGPVIMLITHQESRRLERDEPEVEQFRMTINGQELITLGLNGAIVDAIRLHEEHH